MQTKEEKDLTVEEQEAVDKYLDEVVSVVVFHKHTLAMAGKDVHRRHISAFARQAIESHGKSVPDRAYSDSEYAIFIVNFQTKNISIQAIE